MNAAPFDVRKGIIDGEPAEALFSQDGRYRYRLTRRIGSAPSWYRNRLVFVMLNPSTAGHDRDDNTWRRCIGYARRGNYAAAVAVNLFALVATNPRRLLADPDPVGPDNDAVLTEIMTGSGMRLVAAWGVPASAAVAERAELVTGAAAVLGVTLHMIGQPTKDGHPRHPLYSPGNAPIVVRRMRA